MPASLLKHLWKTQLWAADAKEGLARLRKGSLFWRLGLRVLEKETFVLQHRSLFTLSSRRPRANITG